MVPIDDRMDRLLLKTLGLFLQPSSALRPPYLSAIRWWQNFLFCMGYFPCETFSVRV